MLFIISPAKALDFAKIEKDEHSTPVFLDRADRLAQKLKKKSPRVLKRLFHVSEDIAQLNYDRYQNWNQETIDLVGKKALYAFNGHAYQKIEVGSLSYNEIEYANKHLRILSGMYGLLKPTDLIFPHRLEMGTKWPVSKKNLYGYWSKLVTNELNKTMAELESNILINLASIEYFKVVDKKALKGKIINVEFKEKRGDGNYATVSIFAKQGRGSMCRYAFQNNVRNPEELMAFDVEGYQYRSQLSDEYNYVFTRG